MQKDQAKTTPVSDDKNLEIITLLQAHLLSEAGD